MEVGAAMTRRKSVRRRKSSKLEEEEVISRLEYISQTQTSVYSEKSARSINATDDYDEEADIRARVLKVSQRWDSLHCTWR